MLILQVNSYYKRGMEIGSHSVTHTNVDTEQKLVFEAGKQKDNLTNIGGVPRDQVGSRQEGREGGHQP